jgi:hypothetical protein
MTRRLSGIWQPCVDGEAAARAAIREAGVVGEIRQPDGTIVDVGADGRDVIDVQPLAARRLLPRPARSRSSTGRRRRNP